MTPTLRKRHFQIWILLSLLLPLGFILGLLAIPASAPTSQDVMLTRQVMDLLPSSDKRQAHGQGWEAQIKQDDTGVRYIEIEVNQERRSPSTWVYLFGKDDKQRIPLFGIGEQGTYQVSIDSAQDISGLLLYDRLKQDTLEQVNFQ